MASKVANVVNTFVRWVASMSLCFYGGHHSLSAHTLRRERLNARVSHKLVMIIIYALLTPVSFSIYFYVTRSDIGKQSQIQSQHTAAAKLLEQRPRVREIECQRFFAPPDLWDGELQKMAEMTPAEEVFDYRDCRKLKAQFVDIPTTPAEQEFPMAFTIMVYHDVQRLTRLLRAVYRTSNIYCIHVDQRADEELKSSVYNLTSCFDNVFLPPDPIKVWWGSWESLEAEMVCLRALWKHKLKWIAFINLTGEEFPLKTNLEIIHILHIMGHTNDVWLDPCTFLGPGDHKSRECQTLSKKGFQERWDSLPPPPHNIQPYKGQVHAVLFRPAVDYILHNATAQDIYRWVNFTFIPDELFFSTINSNPHLGMPGSNPTPRKRRPSVARAKLWYRDDQKIWRHCQEYLRHLCKLTARELPLLTTSRQLFANKFRSDYQPMGYSCLEQWYFERVLWEMLTNEAHIDLHQYHQIFHWHYHGEEMVGLQDLHG